MFVLFESLERLLFVFLILSNCFHIYAIFSRIAFLRIVTDYDQMTGGKYIDAELRNDFLMATRVRVNHDRGVFN